MKKSTNKTSENNYKISRFFLKFNQKLWQKSYLQNIRYLYKYIDGILLKFIKKPEAIQSKRKKVLVIYNLALGDGIMLLGVAGALRKIYPEDQYELTLTCQSAFAQLYKNYDIFDNILPLDFSGSVVNLTSRKQLFEKLREEYYDIIIDPVGSENCSTNIWVAHAAVGTEKIGVLDTTFKHMQCPEKLRKKIYTKIIKINKPNLHLIEYYAEFFNRLKPEVCVAHPANLKRVSLNFDLPKKYFIVFPTASMAVKRWPVEAFAEIAKKIYSTTQLPMVTCGTEHDRLDVDKFRKLTPEIPIIDCIGKTNIMEFCEVIGRAALILTNDTSAYHIAVAQQCPTALIAGGYTYTRYANYHYSSLGYKDPVLVSKYMDCYDCNNHCIYNNRDIFPCISGITVTNAWEKIEKLIVKEGLKNEF